MGNIVELRKLVRDSLNDNCLDPKASRTGTHFFDTSDEFNFNRKDTFPKGYLKHEDSPGATISPIGGTGYSIKYGTISIYYYAAEKQNFTDNGITYANDDIVSIMMSNIKQCLLDFPLQDYKILDGGFAIDQGPQVSTLSNFKLWFGVITVTYYWADKYGSTS